MPLVLEGLRRRLGLAAVAWACATVIVTTAVLGAVFAHAAAESDLRDVLTNSQPSTAVRFQMRSADGFEQLTPAEAEAALRSPAAGLRSRYYTPPVAALYVSAGPIGAKLAAQGSGPDAPLVYRTDACAHVRVLHGRCPSGPDEAMVSVRSVARPYGYHLGRRLVLYPDSGGDVSVKVVGVYAPRDTTDPYWGGPQYFNDSPSGPAATLDAVFLDRSFFTRLRSAPVVRASFDRFVATGHVRLRDLPELERAAQGFRDWSRQHGDAFNTSTQLRPVLDRAAGQRTAIYTSAGLVVLQLCVLGWVTLFRILQEFIGNRDAEVVLAKLRGYRLAALIRFSSLESIIVLLIAAPTGIVAGWILAGGLAKSVLLPGTPVVLSTLALLAGVAATAGGAVAVTVSAVLLLRRSIGEQSRRTRQTAQPSRLLALLDVVTVLAAAAAFIVLRTGGVRGGPVTLLAPGLLIVAVATSASRLLPLLLAPLVRRTANHRRVALLLAVRQVVRRPAGRRLVSLLTVAVGLAIFGVSGEAIATQNRDARASVEVGASAVQRITVVVGDDPVAAVRRADPDGRWAAAAARWLTFGGTDLRGTLLAVDSGRLPAVTPTVANIQDPDALEQAIQGPVAPVVLWGRRVQVQATLSDLRGNVPTLLLELLGSDGSEIQADFGDLHPGRRTYTAMVRCSTGCVLVGVNLNASVEGRTATGVSLIQRISMDGRQVRAGLHVPAAWRVQQPLGDAKDRIRVDTRGVSDRFTLGLGGTGGVAHNGLPDPVPALVTAPAVSSSSVGAHLSVTSSDEKEAKLQVAGLRTVLPGVVGDGVLSDASVFRGALPTFVADAAWEVWLGPNTPADARQRLTRAGLVLDGQPSTLASRQAALAREGPALALLLLQVMGIAGVLCAVCGVVVSIRAVLRRRSYEAAALLTVGVTRRQLLWAILLEQVLLLGSAVLTGVPVGLLAIILTMPAQQQSNTISPVPQAVFPPPGPILITVAVLITLVLIAVSLSGLRVVRAANTGRLREGEE